MMTVSAVARLIPRPPDLVDNRKQNCSAPGAAKYSIEFEFKKHFIINVGQLFSFLKNVVTS